MFCDIFRFLSLGREIQLHSLWFHCRGDLPVHQGRERSWESVLSVSVFRLWTRLAWTSLSGWTRQASRTTSSSTATPSVVVIQSVSSSTWLRRWEGPPPTGWDWTWSSWSMLSLVRWELSSRLSPVLTSLPRWEVPGIHLWATLPPPLSWSRNGVQCPPTFSDSSDNNV